MRACAGRVFFTCFVCCSVSIGCQDRPRSRVSYASQEPFGTWYVPEDSQAHVEEDAPAKPDAATPSEPDGPVTPRPRPDESGNGSGGSRSPARGGAGASGNAAGAAAARAGTTAGGGASAKTTHVVLDYTTDVQHAREWDTALPAELVGTREACADPGSKSAAPPPKVKSARGPCNVGIVWVTSSAGELIDVIEYWGGKGLYAEHLVAFAVAKDAYRDSHSDSADLNKYVRADAVSGATLLVHEPHSVTWNHSNWKNEPVPAGEYKFSVEVADYDTNDEKGAANAMIELMVDTAKGTYTMGDYDARYYPQVSVRFESE